MRKQLLTLLLIITITTCFGQKVDTAVFNGVKKIIITTNLSAKDNYLLAGKMMLEQGYNVGLKDSEFFQISSEPVKVAGQGSVHLLSIYAVCTDNKILITGKTKNTASMRIVSFQDQETAYDVMEYKRLNQVSKGVWLRLATYAKSIPHNSITYSE